MKKKIISIAIALSILIGSMPIDVFADEVNYNSKIEIKFDKSYLDDEGSNQVVNIPDKNLKKEINRAMEKDSNADITVGELKGITSLMMQSAGISSIEGIQYCTNLTSLNLLSNSISDISQLKELTKLETLKIYANYIADASPLSGLTNLRYLDLCYNKITDISPLSELKNLEYLSLSYNGFSDLSPLKGLKALQTLEAEGNKITDIRPILGLNNLKELYLEDQRIVNDVINSIGSYAESKNPILNKQGEPLAPSKIFNNGKYILGGNMVIWNDLTSNLSTAYKFSEDIRIGQADAAFSGVVEQYIIYKEKTNTKPVINGANNLSIKQGTAFNPMSGVEANDVEDGNITGNIIINGEVDVNKPGDYELTYSVTDSDGNITEVKRIVRVNPQWIEINSAPILELTDSKITINYGDKINLLDYVKEAYDNEDGNLLEKVRYEIENFGDDTDVEDFKPGTYNIIYTVIDLSGAKTSKQLILIVEPLLEETPDNDINEIPDKDIDVIPEEIENPNNQSNSEIIDVENVNGNNKLPNTGSESKLPIMGLLLISIGYIFIFRRKK